MYCARERGIAALQESKIKGWLIDCDQAARDQINQRIERLKAEGALR